MMTATFATPRSMLYHIPVNILVIGFLFIIQYIERGRLQNLCTCYAKHFLEKGIQKLTNVFGSGCHWSAQLGHKLFGIKSYFYNVV